jgi:PRTRC genetic system protein C
MGKRIFIVDNREHPDPDPKLSVDEVRQQMITFYPELTNAETKQSNRGEDTIVRFEKRTGTKGVMKIEDIADELCRCGHLLSEHGDTLAKGHGGCLCPQCACLKFTWKAFIMRKESEAKAKKEIPMPEKHIILINLATKKILAMSNSDLKYIVKTLAISDSDLKNIVPYFECGDSTDWSNAMILSLSELRDD